MEDGGFFLLI